MLDVLTTEKMSAPGASRPIVVALSGGGDSTALLNLMVERFSAERLVAGIVDHGLRRGSAEDATRAAHMAETLGVPAHITALTWEEGANRSQHNARQRRYAALSTLANHTGAAVIATGHNRDDQAETVLMRASREARWRNLVCMRAVTRMPLWPEGRGLWLGRPLLGVRRAALRDYLSARGANWIEDPSNSSIHYERVLMRQRLAEQEAVGFDTMRLAAIAERLAPLAAQIDDAASALIAKACGFDDGRIIIDLGAWDGADTVRQRAFQALLTAAGASLYPPDAPRTRVLEVIMRGSARRPFTGQTFAGALVKKRGDTIVISRDRGAVYGRADGARAIPRLPLEAGIEVVWDRRVALTIDEPGWSVVLGRNATPELERGEERAALAAAAPHWLLKERAQHVLGQD